MSDKPVLSLQIRRNPDGTFSVVDTCAGIRLVKAGFTSYADAKQFCDAERLLAAVDVRPNWKEKPGMPDDWQGRSAWEE
jgi:hypothetical protein